MAGIYIHIPFCKQACHYCNFHFATSLHYKNDLIDALLKEIGLQKNYLGGEIVETIYIGGGTPSLCSAAEIKKLLDAVRNYYPLTDDPEITIEANPDDISEVLLEEWKQAGVNRLSIGVQSFFEEDLRWMNRAHNAGQAIDSLNSAKKYFSNITIDLIYGFPLLSNEKWKQNVDRIIAFDIPHISCYALTVESKTPLDKMISQKKTAPMDPDKQSEQFLLLMQWLENAGYEHYEISNYAKPSSSAGKPGWKSRHNSSYWRGKKYLGIGPSAHSFNGSSRQWNVANNRLYIESINTESVPFEKEELSSTQKLNEYIMTSLRTMEGTALGIAGNGLLEKSKKFRDRGLMKLVFNSLVLTKEGKLLADGIAADLFY